MQPAVVSGWISSAGLQSEPSDTPVPATFFFPVITSAQAHNSEELTILSYSLLVSGAIPFFTLPRLKLTTRKPPTYFGL